MHSFGSFRGTALPQRPQQTVGARPAARQRTALQRPSAIAAPSRAAEIEPLSDELKPLVEEKGVDWEKSGLKYLSNEARVRCFCEAALVMTPMAWPSLPVSPVRPIPLGTP